MTNLTITALKNLYVKLGGNAADVTNVTLIPDMIDAIVTVAGGGGGGGKTMYNHSICIQFSGDNLGSVSAYINIISSTETAMTLETLASWINTNGARATASTAKYYHAYGAITGGCITDVLYNGTNLKLDAISGGIATDDTIPSDATIYDTVTEI